MLYSICKFKKLKNITENSYLNCPKFYKKEILNNIKYS